MSVFKDKILLITGGTGSFGNAVLRRFLQSDIKEIKKKLTPLCFPATAAVCIP